MFLICGCFGEINDDDDDDDDKLNKLTRLLLQHSAILLPAAEFEADYQIIPQSDML